MGLRSQNNPIASFKDVFSATGKDAVRAAPPVASASGLDATGGIINDYTEGNNVYRTHIFTSSGTFTVNSIGDFPSEIDYLVVGGGGGGGGAYEAGGGGAGGYRTTCPEGPGGPGGSESAYTVSAGQYTVTVGGGGQGGSNLNANLNAKGRVGSQSAFFPTPQGYPHPTYIRSEGGGGGATYSEATPHTEALGVPGGSGGGAANCHPSGPAAGGTANRVADSSTAVPTQGYKGGNRGPQPHSAYYNGAGGGGAGAAGANQNDNTLPGSFGGNGKRTSITGPGYTIGTPGPSSAGGTGGGDSTAVTGGWLAGGGGGGLYGYPNMAHLPQTRGAGGGGAGGHGGSPTVDATVAVANTGSGGGGSGDVSYTGGAGASGIVVIRYLIAQLSGIAKATGGNISFYNGKTIHTFVSSGTFTSTGGDITQCEYILIGGGGGGGAAAINGYGGGGGGAGQYLQFGPITIPAPAKPVVIGGGGQAWVYGQSANVPGAVYNTRRGQPTTFNGQVAGGGGAGGTHGNGPGSPPFSGFDGFPGTPGGTGSGGGKAGYDNGPAGAGTGSPPGGFPGGELPTSNNNAGCGGGGAGGAGGNAAYPTGGLGGAGVTLPTTFLDSDQAFGGAGPGRSYGWVAGGGAGGVHAPPNNSTTRQGAGGGGPIGTQVNPNAPSSNPSFATPWAGGGNGGHGRGDNTARSGEHGMGNTGGGGGGGGSSVPQFADGGNGGSGLVLIAYPT